MGNDQAQITSIKCRSTISNKRQRNIRNHSTSRKQMAKKLKETIEINGKLDCKLMTVSELKRELKIRGLSINGNKATLLARLSFEADEINHDTNSQFSEFCRNSTKYLSGEMVSLEDKDIKNIGCKRSSEENGNSNGDQPSKKRKTETTPEEDLLRYCKTGNLPEVHRCLASGVSPDARHPLGWAALHVAAVARHPGIVEALISAGAALDAGDRFSTYDRVARDKALSPLYVMQARVTQFFPGIGSGYDCSGSTALHYASFVNDARTVDVLLEAGADPTVKNQSGHSAAYFCQSNAIIKMIEDATKEFQEKKALMALEERRKFPLDQRLKQKLIGQRLAIATVVSALRSRESGLYDREHPLVLLFLGTSGTGKTEMAKQLSHYMHQDNAHGFIRMDMSEYQEKHEVVKLIGAPPGYKDHDEGGQLTTALTKCPTAVVLFDEIEKAHPDCLTVLLQLFDEGRLTDGKGKTIICKDATFVMTSNLASEAIAKYITEMREEAGFRAAMHRQDDVKAAEKVTLCRKVKNEVVMPILKQKLKRDEFIGRINKIVYFLPFTDNELTQLVERELRQCADRAQAVLQVELLWDDKVVSVLKEGFNVRFGARSIKHEIEERITDPLSLAHEHQQIAPGCRVRAVAAARAHVAADAALRLQVCHFGSETFSDLEVPDEP